MMLGLRRRSRAFLAVAVIFTLGFYHLRRVRKWDIQSIGLSPAKDLGYHIEFTSSLVASTTSTAVLDGSLAAPQGPNTVAPRPALNVPIPPHDEPTLLDDASVAAAPQPAGEFQHTPENSVVDTQPAISESDRVIVEDTPSNKFEYVGQGRLEIDKHGASLRRSHWQQQKEHFPVPSNEIIPLPTAPPKRIPVVQYKFKPDTKDEKTSNEQRLGDIKKAFQHAWSGYKQFAAGHDELAPISRDFKDPFNGWGATLVDTLDTLWIMDLKDEFNEAVQMVKDIDFTTSIRKDIPLFETVIRYLGGLIAAYDVSSSEYPVLLEKALELAEILMGAFDTPNRMPMMYYNWAPSYASQPHRASTKVVLAELGSLSLEFTRLAQITKENKYYDAVARITNELETWQNSTNLPGLWPSSVDASGCRKPDALSKQDAHPASHNPQFAPPVQKAATIISDKIDSNPQKRDGSIEQGVNVGSVDQGQAEAPGDLGANDSVESSPSPRAEPTKSFPDLGKSHDDKIFDVEADCQPQGLASPPRSKVEKFTLGALSDSTYEYLPKEWLLLGGLEDQYRSMYLDAMEVVKDALIYRPMTETERDILFAGTWRANVSPEAQRQADYSEGSLQFEGEHLTCFAGGMFALGAKIFSLDADLDIARRLTDGCVWAYESTATGIMPESFHLVPCESDQQCAWNATRWSESLDPDRSAREAEAKKRQAKQKHLGQSESLVETEEPDRYQDAEEPDRYPDADMPSARHATDENAEKRESSVQEDGPVGGPPSVEELHKRQVSGSSEGIEEGKYSPNEPTRTHSEFFQGGSDKEAAEVSDPSAPVSTPRVFASHEEFVQARIKDERLPAGFSAINSGKYILRPEAIESVFIMYRVTGDRYWQEQGWKMFTAIQGSTQTQYANSAITDVTKETPPFSDSMESFWLAETLKYFYLLYSDPGLISLDEYVLNTEAHPFKRPI